MTTTEEVWRELRDDLYAFLRRRVSDEHLAEDLLQETFVRVHDGLDGLSSRDRLAPWVRRIARNAVIDHYRSAGATGVAEALELAAIAEPSPAENRNAEASGWIPALVALLPPEARAAVELAELRGLPLKEVAAELGITLSAAKSRVQRGRARMRELLDACCRFEVDRRGNVLDWRRRGDGCSCEGREDPEDGR